MTKKELRSLMKTREVAFLQDGNPSADSASIISALEREPSFVSARTILCYMSIPGEVEIDSAFPRWNKEKRVVLPVVKGERLELREYGPDMLVPGYKGIPEPSADAPLVNPSEVDLALIPGIAFCRRPDGKVLRMGRGKGFYDRLIPELSCLKAGVCYPFRIVGDMETDPWDAPLDCLFSL